MGGFFKGQDSAMIKGKVTKVSVGKQAGGSCRYVLGGVRLHECWLRPLLV